MLAVTPYPKHTCTFITLSSLESHLDYILDSYNQRETSLQPPALFRSTLTQSLEDPEASVD